MDINELYHELIIDHGTHPRNCRLMENPCCSAEGFNPLCGDKVKVYLNFVDHKITEATFEGSGCAISMASTSLMTEALQGKTMEQALKLFGSFQHLLTTDIISVTEETHQTLGKLVALLGVKHFPARVKCATLAWHTLLSALKNESKITEENE